jgi:2-polyprenyl-3-methyl-5-hydroxy-6-metoxy-1,4-benzoquinol methylase
MTSQREPDIVKRQYSSDENLRVRHETHERYTVPKKNFVEWAINCLNWRGDERVLDVGCGPGLYFSKLQDLHPNISYVGVDLMPAMLANHPANKQVAVSNILTLPFADAQFDVVMANHMLYHVEDVEGALQELRRVLKPDGMVMIATNSLNTMPELQVLMRRAIVLLTRQGAAQVRAPALPSDHFALENGTRMLAKHFFAVVRHDLPSALVFPDVEPAIAYLESSRDLRSSQLPTDVSWDDVMMIMRQQINQLIKHLGELVINKQTGLLIASDRGGFIQEYVERIQPNIAQVK